MKKLIPILPICLIFSLLTGLRAEEQPEKTEKEINELIDATIAKARAYMGGDEKLNEIKSILYKGTLLYSDGTTGTAEIIFKKPYFQRFVAVLGDMKETTALNDLEAWRKQEKVGVPGIYSAGSYTPVEMYNMRASVWEYLNFYKKPTGPRKGVSYIDEVMIGKVPCVVLRYDHGDGIQFDRYFETETGRVARTVSTSGSLFVEEGEMMIDGIRFPKKLTTVFLTVPGDQKIEMVYSSIKVNTEVDNKIFKFPQNAN